MKKQLVLTTAIILFTTAVFAQKTNFPKYYGTMGIGTAPRSGFTAQLGFKAVFPSKWTVSAGYTSFSGNAEVPSDYIARQVGGYMTWIGIGVPATELIPETKTGVISLSAGRFVPLSRSVYFFVDAGIGLAKGEYFSFDKDGDKTTGEYASYSPNYAISSKDVSAFGGLFKTGFDFAFSDVIGMGVDAYYNYNGGGIAPNYGVNFRIIVGSLHRGPKTVH